MGIETVIKPDITTIIIGEKPLSWENIRLSPSEQCCTQDSPSCFPILENDRVLYRIKAKATKTHVSLRPRVSLVIDDMEAISFTAEVVNDPFVGGKVVKFNAQLKYPRSHNGPERLKDFPSGSELIASAWNFFLIHHPDLVGIRAKWEQPDFHHRGDNYETYQKALSQNMSSEEAALFTWTGQQAKTLLKHPRVIFMPPSTETKTPTIFAYFLKPAA